MSYEGEVSVYQGPPWVSHMRSLFHPCIPFPRSILITKYNLVTLTTKGGIIT